MKKSNTKISLTEYAEALGMSRQAAYKRLSINKCPGISRTEKVGNTLTLYKSPDYEECIKKFKNS